MFEFASGHEFHYKSGMNKNNLFTLFFIVFLDLVGIGIMIPVLAPLMLDPASALVPTVWTESTRNIALGILIAAYPLAQFLGSPILGTLSDNYGRKKLLIFSLVGTLLGYLLFAYGLFTNQLWLLYVSRILDGFTGGNIGVANSSIADMSTPKNRAQNFGLIGMAFGFGFIVGPFLGGQLANPELVSWFNASTPFLFAACLSAVNLFLLTFKYKETLKERFVRKVHPFLAFEHIGKAFRMKNLRTMFLVVFLHTLGFCFFTQFFPVFLVHKFDMNPAQIGTLFGFTGIWIALSQGLFTRIAARFFIPEKILKFSLFLLALSLLAVTIPNATWMLFVTQPFLAIFEGLTYPNATAVVSKLSPVNEQGEAMGVTQSLRALGQALPPLLAGFLVSINQNLAILTGSAIILLAGAIFVICFRPQAQKS